MELLFNNPIVGLSVSILGYGIGAWVKKKTGSSLANPLAIGSILVILLINLSPLSLESYQVGGSILTMFLVPVTTILALYIYEQWRLLKENAIPVLCGCVSGSVASIVSVVVLCRVFNIEEALTASLLPKSVTTAIALELSETVGGLVPITVSAVILTGIMSAVASPIIIKTLRLDDPIAIGTAIGTSGHAIGTARALEYGKTEGAMSSIALVLSAVITSSLFVVFY